MTDVVEDGQGLDASAPGDRDRPAAGHAALSHAALSKTGLFGFSLGMIGERIFRDAPALLLLLFMTDYLAIPPALAGVAIFIPKIVIAFVDPLVGTLSDGGGR